LILSSVTTERIVVVHEAVPDLQNDLVQVRIELLDLAQVRDDPVVPGRIHVTRIQEQENRHHRHAQPDAELPQGEEVQAHCRFDTCSPLRVLRNATMRAMSVGGIVTPS
jgi:hypothetical protein